MGDFTSGILYKNKDSNQVDRYLQEAPCHYKSCALNGSWNVFCLEDGFLQKEQTRKFLLEVGEFPLLYFLHARDHGWGYSIYFNREMTCSVLLDYGLEYSMAKKLIKKRFPLEADIYNIASSEWNAAFDEARRSAEYHRALTDSLSSARPENFKLFGLDDNLLLEIKRVFDVSWLTEGDNLCKSVNRFEDLLGIKEMEELNYRRPDIKRLCKTS